MKRFFAKVHNVKHLVHLKEDRKAAVRAKLIEFMEQEPIPQGTLILTDRRAKPRGLFSGIFHGYVPAFSMALILVLLGTSTTFGAERALPGDFLYAVKVGFNEKIKGAFQLTPEAKASYETELAARRLDEAAELATRGDVSEVSSAEIEKSFNEHAERAQTEIATVKAHGNVGLAADLVSHFETELRAHEKMLVRTPGENAASLEDESQGSIAEPVSAQNSATLSATGTATSGQQLQGIATSTPPKLIKRENRLSVRVRNALIRVGALRANIESEIEHPQGFQTQDDENRRGVAAEAKVRAATKVVAEARAYIQAKKVDLGAEATANAEARLVLADSLLSQAEAKITAKAFGEAFNLGNRAIRVGQEAKLIVRARTELKVNVDLDDDVTHINPTGEATTQIKVDSDDKESDDAGLDANIQGGVKLQGKGVLDILRR